MMRIGLLRGPRLGILIFNMLLLGPLGSSRDNSSAAGKD